MNSPRPPALPRVPLRMFAAGLVVVIGVFTATVKHLDEDNRFCIACHLHQEIYDRMTAAPPAPAPTLAAAHSRAHHARHAERCFTCHSGEGVVGWSQVTLLSAWDAARWVAGDRHEPTAMRLPLTNDACLKCHLKDVQGTMSADETAAYHALSDHRSVKLACASCHVTHTGGMPEKQFLDAATVRARCQTCHRERAGEGES